LLIDTTAGLTSLVRPVEKRGHAMTAAAPVRPAAPHQGVLSRHPLTFFFIFTYAFSWLAWMRSVWPSQRSRNALVIGYGT
jgi:hypothetical protein